MKKVLLPIVFVVISAITVIISCRLVADTDISTKGVYALRLSSGDVSPWTEDQDGYRSFKPGTLFDVINGGCEKYNEHGLIEGFVQYISNSSKLGKIYIMDFGTEANATEMYKYMELLNTDKSSAGDYDLTIAQINNSPSSGVNAYAHFGQYYIELSFTEFSEKSDARSAAIIFIEFFEAKIQML